MIVVTYKPAADHPNGGPITGCVKGTVAMIATLAEPWVEVAEWRNNWDATHFVLEGVVTPIPEAITEAQDAAMAKVRLKVRSETLIRDIVDPVISNPIQWEAMTPEQQQLWTDCRQALTDWPENETSPQNPTIPTVVASVFSAAGINL